MPSKSKVEIEEKVKIIREYIAGNISRGEAARRGGVAPSSISSWAQKYRAEGALSLTPAEKNRVYSLELRRQAVLEYLAGGCSQRTAVLLLSEKNSIVFHCPLDGMRFKIWRGLFFMYL